MHPYLTRLGIRQEVQQYFEPFYHSDDAGNLCFNYGADFEHYGFGFHRVPAVSGFWMAGNLNFFQVRLIIVCASALECIAWLHNYGYLYPDTLSLLFLSTGASLCSEHMVWLREHLRGKEFLFAFGSELLCRLTAIKLAAGIRGQRLSVFFLAEEKIQILFREQTFLFSPQTLTLHALEKAARFRFRVRISTPKNYNTFFEQLKAGAGLTF
ncbi:MAG: hypothetical protein JST32_20150 [Bacteroidetes bacterium]|nr:hypothetical protein [Bacteroidota bacterium]